MNLHEDNQVFKEFVETVAAEKGLPESFIEKDYYVSLLLKNINEEFPNIIFKGGTSLSKCYGIIKRFSEDIDINIVVDDGEVTNPIRKKLKKSIMISIEKSGMTLKNEHDIGARRDFNKYRVAYNTILDSNDGLNDDLIVESYLSLKSFPFERKKVNNYIHDYLHNGQHLDLIKKYNIEPFEINVQSITRTFIDKFFAICDYHEKAAYHQNSRHLYDLHQIFSHNNFQDDDEFGVLFYEVVKERRKKIHINISSEKGYELKRVLTSIFQNDYYKSDYQEITLDLLFEEESITYETVKNTITKILESGIIPDVLE